MKYSAILPLVPLAIAAHNDVVQQKNVLAADVASGAASVADAATSGAAGAARSHAGAEHDGRAGTLFGRVNP